MSFSKQKREDRWELDAIFDEINFKTPDGKKFRYSREQFLKVLLVESGMLEEIYEEEFEVEGSAKDGRTDKIDYFTDSKWGRMISDPRISISKSKEGKEFRRKFRVPYPVFKNILVPESERLNVFEVKDWIRIRVPTEMKLLCAYGFLHAVPIKMIVPKCRNAFDLRFLYFSGNFYAILLQRFMTCM